LASLEPPLHIFGGVAESVLLDGRLRDDHGDLDVLIPRDELELRAGQLSALGFSPLTVYYEPRPGLPLVYGCERGDLHLELSIVDYDETGAPYFVANGAAITVASDLFDWPATVVAGIPIRTVSPLALVHVRAGLTQTGVFGPPRPEKDILRQQQLIDAFLSKEPPEALEPRITPLP
jgi:hypothetical protein